MVVFIKKGDAPLSIRQAEKRGMAYVNQAYKPYEREALSAVGNADFKAWVEQFEADNVINAANNLFNHQIAGYRKSVARLDQYLVADGRLEEVAEQPTGEIDPDTGEPITETVITQTAVDPLPAQIEQLVYDSETGEQTGTEMVSNPVIVQDYAERSAAQAVIDDTPQEVKDFAVEI